MPQVPVTTLCTLYTVDAEVGALVQPAVSTALVAVQIAQHIVVTPAWRIVFEVHKAPAAEATSGDVVVQALGRRRELAIECAERDGPHEGITWCSASAGSGTGSPR